MKKLDTKGMTLVETVVAILIISIASVLLLESFSAVTKVISGANNVESATSEQLATLVGGTTNEKIKVDVKNEKAQILVEGSSTPIYVDGSYMTATGIDNRVSLRHFVATEVELDTYQLMLERMRNIYNETKDMTAIQKNEYLAILEKEAGVTTGLTCVTSARNDELRVFYYLKYGHPKMKTEIIEECNKIYDSMHPTPGTNTHESRVKIGERQMYLKPYYIGATHEVLLYGVYTDGIQSDGWSTNIIYDEAEKSLYYKVFPATSTHGDIGGYYNLASSKSLAQLRIELHGDGWKKLSSR